jgi:hypothetical protein
MNNPGAHKSSTDSSGQSGLPLFRSWQSVYLLVLGSFAVWVGLLILLTELYS